MPEFAWRTSPVSPLRPAPASCPSRSASLGLFGLGRVANHRGPPERATPSGASANRSRFRKPIGAGPHGGQNPPDPLDGAVLVPSQTSDAIPLGVDRGVPVGGGVRERPADPGAEDTVVVRRRAVPGRHGGAAGKPSPSRFTSGAGSASPGRPRSSRPPGGAVCRPEDERIPMAVKSATGIVARPTRGPFRFRAARSSG